MEGDAAIGNLLAAIAEIPSMHNAKQGIRRKKSDLVPRRNRLKRGITNGRILGMNGLTTAQYQDNA